jgi:hypothetical protein
VLIDLINFQIEKTIVPFPLFFIMRFSLLCLNLQSQRKETLLNCLLGSLKEKGLLLLEMLGHVCQAGSGPTPVNFCEPVVFAALRMGLHFTAMGRSEPLSINLFKVRINMYQNAEQNSKAIN